MKRCLILCLLSFWSQIILCQETPIDIFIKAGNLFASSDGKLVQNQIIHVNGNRIVEVGSALTIPKGSRIIDLSNYTVLPGLIDSHTHLLFSTKAKGDIHYEKLRMTLFEGDALRVLRASSRANTYLNVGITTVKDLGNSGQFLDVALKQAINEGSITGPRMFVSGPILSSEGGQFPSLIKDFQDIVDLEYRVIKGVDDATVAVRENITYGADIIKICSYNTPLNTSLLPEEMEAIVKTAHKYGRKVTAHATNNQAVLEAIQAGIDGIEHGNEISDTTMQLMAKKQIFLVPTDHSYEDYLKLFHYIGIKGNPEEWAKNRFNQAKSRLIRAMELGVPIVAGSDAFIDFGIPMGQASKNVLKAYIEYGINPLKVLQFATYNAAKFMSKEKELGVISKGAFADIIAVRGNIEEDFNSAIDQIVFVMKDGNIYVGK